MNRMNRMMDIRNVELSVEDILSIHRHWITKLYLDDHKSEMEIVGMLYERRLPVTIAQIQNCLSEWDLVSSPLASRRSSSSNNSSIESASEGDWEALRSPSPTSSSSSYYSTTPENVALYSTRPLPSLPKSASSSVSGLKPKPLRHPKLRHTKSNICTNTNTNTTIPTRFADRSPSLNLTKITCHQTRTRSYEVETTLSPIESGLSPIEIFTNDMSQSHERIAVGLRRIRVNYPGRRKEVDEFEWMRQFRDFKLGGKREVKIYQGDDFDYEADDE